MRLNGNLLVEVSESRVRQVRMVVFENVDENVQGLLTPGRCQERVGALGQY